MRALLASLAARCDLAALDDLANLHGTNLTWSHLSFGDRPFWNAENGVIDGSTGIPAASLVAALALEFDTFVDDADTEVFVWPAVAAPGFRWDNLSNEEIAALTAQFGDAVVSFSIEQGVWTSFSVEIDATGGWRSFSQPLT